jgi:hypothetical protein
MLASWPAGAEALRIVDSVSLEDVRSAMREAGLDDLQDRTRDPNYPSLSSQYQDDTTVQATLFACAPTPAGCMGAELASPIAVKSKDQASQIANSLDRELFGFDVTVLSALNESGKEIHIVSISSYLIFDHGVSDRLLPRTLERLLQAVDRVSRLRKK